MDFEKSTVDCDFWKSYCKMWAVGKAKIYVKAAVVLSHLQAYPACHPHNCSSFSRFTTNYGGREGRRHWCRSGLHLQEEGLEAEELVWAGTAHLKQVTVPTTARRGSRTHSPPHRRNRGPCPPPCAGAAGRVGDHATKAEACGRHHAPRPQHALSTGRLGRGPVEAAPAATAVHRGSGPSDLAEGAHTRRPVLAGSRSEPGTGQGRVCSLPRWRR